MSDLLTLIDAIRSVRVRERQIASKKTLALLKSKKLTANESALFNQSP